MRFIVNKEGITLNDAIALAEQPREKVAVDIETVSLDNQLPLGIGIAISPKIGFYFFDTEDELAKEMVSSVTKVAFQNAAFDIPKLRKLGYQIARVRSGC